VQGPLRTIVIEGQKARGKSDGTKESKTNNEIMTQIKREQLIFDKKKRIHSGKMTDQR